MTQSRTDSLLEASTNIAVGFALALIGNFTFIPIVMGVSPSISESFWIATLFTALSLARQYVIRRCFNGKSVYQGLKTMMTGDQKS